MHSKELKKILHAEDDAAIREIVWIALVEIGDFKLLQCKDGEEAISKAEDFEPDLFLIDLKMQGIDGIRTLQMLRKISSVSNIPAILMTAKADDNEINNHNELQILGVIEKPFDPITLADTIKQIWNKNLQQ